jgi:molecular chaperone GrpE
MAKKDDSHPEVDEKETPEIESGAGVTGENGRPSEKPEELTEEERLRRQVQELQDKLLRAAAEFDNYKKRTARRYDEMARSAADSVLLELLEVVDNFERSLEHSNDKADFEALRKGTEMIYSQMLSLLTKYNITAIEAVGQPFDPGLHDATMQMDTDEYDDGIVALEMSKGYRCGDRVLRHSKVGVSTGKGAPESDEKEQ